MTVWMAATLCVLGLIGAVLSIRRVRKSKLYALIAAVCIVLTLASGLYVAAAALLAAGVA